MLIYLANVRFFRFLFIFISRFHFGQSSYFRHQSVPVFQVSRRSIPAQSHRRSKAFLRFGWLARLAIDIAVAFYRLPTVYLSLCIRMRKRERERERERERCMHRAHARLRASRVSAARTYLRINKSCNEREGKRRCCHAVCRQALLVSRDSMSLSQAATDPPTLYYNLHSYCNGWLGLTPFNLFF